MSFEIVLDKPWPSRANRFMRALVASRPGDAQTVLAYRGCADAIVVYGPGKPERQAYIRQHLKKGGHVVMWDLAYWDRRDSMRLAIDVQHPTPAQLAASTGPARRQFKLREDANPKGPILLVGMGEKSNIQHGLKFLDWEKQAIKDIRERFGKDQRIVLRPKHRMIHIDGADTCLPRTPIEDVLKGMSGVWCRHSNVAIDACVAGIPVYCTHGAAATLYADNPNPTRQQRADFLRALSWWEWNPKELSTAWKFIRERLGRMLG